MDIQNNQIHQTENIVDSRLVTGSVLFVALILMNVILLLDWFGYISIK